MFRVKFCREVALKILFPLDLLQVPAARARQEAEEALGQVRGLTGDEHEFVLELVTIATEHQAEIDRQISDHLVGWKLSRLVAIDRCLLRLGIAEGRLDPAKKPIIIDDVLRIAKKYSEADSYKIINAVLDRVIS